MSSLAFLACSATSGRTAACEKKPIAGFPGSSNKVEGVLPRVLPHGRTILPLALRFCRGHCCSQRARRASEMSQSCLHGVVCSKGLLGAPMGSRRSMCLGAHTLLSLTATQYGFYCLGRYIQALLVVLILCAVKSL